MRAPGEGGDRAALEERYRRLFQYSNDAILIADGEGRIVDANRRAVRLFGWERAELLGRDLAELQAPGGEPRDRRTLTGGGAVLAEIDFRTRSGRVFPAEVAISVVSVGEGAWIQSAIRDVSERRLAERLTVERAALERSNRELDELASIAAHDLQEPLRKIQAFVASLEGRLGPSLDAASRDDFRRLSGSAARLRERVEALLDYARVSTEGTDFKPVDLAEVASEVVADLELAIAESGAVVEVGPLPRIEADRVQIGQLLQNLVANALRFHHPGVPPRVRVSAEIARGDGGAELCRLSVADEGIGFDPEQLATILRPFKRLHGRGEYEGSGLGLAVCQRIAERHGGTISATSAPGQGATFTVTLPRYASPPPGASDRTTR